MNEGWSELAIKFGRTSVLRWERLSRGTNQQLHKVQKEKRRKEGVHAWSSRKDKDLYERVWLYGLLKLSGQVS